jgi:hypothetical protein
MATIGRHVSKLSGYAPALPSRRASAPFDLYQCVLNCALDNTHRIAGTGWATSEIECSSLRRR